MRMMVLVEDQQTEAGALPDTETLDAMGRFNDAVTENRPERTLLLSRAAALS
jgi:hypothetical protein